MTNQYHSSLIRWCGLNKAAGGQFLPFNMISIHIIDFHMIYIAFWIFPYILKSIVNYWYRRSSKHICVQKGRVITYCFRQLTLLILINVKIRTKATVALPKQGEVAFPSFSTFFWPQTKSNGDAEDPWYYGLSSGQLPSLASYAQFLRVF